MLVCLGVYDNFYIKFYLFMKNFMMCLCYWLKCILLNGKDFIVFVLKCFLNYCLKQIIEMNKCDFIYKDENQDVELFFVIVVCYLFCQYGGRCVSFNICYCFNGYFGYSCNICMLIIIYFYFKLLYQYFNVFMKFCIG